MKEKEVVEENEEEKEGISKVFCIIIFTCILVHLGFNIRITKTE